ncbi:CBS domain-containing protein [Tenacibaculum agarivorans]|uniref:CBS domain-containing protein n=1 Tax=Tenacibaculum agarivorans TaxID=1908389 RepID=UPI00094BA1EC|nr:CBS domain-containing protein [Tenacibaculum agarivorans]
MKGNEFVSSIMSTNLVTVKPTDRVSSIKNLFELHKIRHLPVISGQNIVGILSKIDVLEDQYDENFRDFINADIKLESTLTVKELMTKNVVVVDSKTSIRDAAKILSTKEFHALPVVEAKVLVGILTTTDLIQFFIS